MDSFEEMNLEKWIKQVAKFLSYKKPTIVQKYIIPEILQNKSVIAISKTGTGKTASFCLPILSELSKDPYGLYALILEPTRELVIQVEEKLKVFSTGFNLRMCSIIGGEDYTKQLGELNKIPHIIIATPGRVLSFLENNSIKLVQNLKYLVLDEFDQLFNETINPDIEKILEFLPSTRKTLFFSATIQQKKEDLIKYLGKEDDFNKIYYFNSANYDENNKDKNNSESVIKIEKNTINDIKKIIKINEDITLKYILVPQKLKEHYLLYLLREKYNDICTIVFVNHVKQCEFLYNLCKLFDIKVSALHAKMTQKLRRSNLLNFKGSVNKILISTDLAARGLDIQMVDLVINFDMPFTAETFLHRAGRTGRRGEAGLCVSFVSQHDIELLNGIEEKLEVDINEITNINQDDIMVDIGQVSTAIKLVKTKMLKNK